MAHIQAEVDIPDDPSVVEPIFKEVKQSFKSHKTKDIGFRKQVLNKMLEGY